MTRARWVQLDLDPPTSQAAQLGVDLHHVCAVCGVKRTRLWFDDCGRLISRVGDQPCWHLVANLQTTPLDKFFDGD